MSTYSSKMVLIVKLLLLLQGAYAATKCPSPSSYSNILSCKMAGCEYSIQKRACQPLYKDCGNRIGLTGCRRPDTIYIEGGVAFHSKREQGNCRVRDVLFAVNLGSDDDFEDTMGINYANHSADVYTDEELTHKTIQTGGRHCAHGITGIHIEDEPLWSSQIKGSSKRRKSGNCVTYQTKLPNDQGVYELNIKTVETMLPGKKTGRHFNIRINGVVVVPEFNIRNYAPLCKGLEIVIEFEVEDGQLTPVGLKKIELPSNGKVDIDFCYGDGKASDSYNPDYLVSAFYIAEMAGMPGQKFKTCEGIHTRSKVKTSTRKIISSTTTASAASTEVSDEDDDEEEEVTSTTEPDTNTLPTATPPELPNIPPTTTPEPSSAPTSTTSAFPEGSSTMEPNVAVSSGSPPVKPPTSSKPSGKENSKNSKRRKKKHGGQLGDSVIAVKKYVGKLGIFG